MRWLIAVGGLISALALSITGMRWIGHAQPAPGLDLMLVGPSYDPACVPPRCWNGIEIGHTPRRQIREIMSMIGRRLPVMPIAEAWQVRHNDALWRVSISNIEGPVPGIFLEPPPGSVRLGDLIAAFGQPVELSGGTTLMNKTVMLRAEIRFNGVVYAYVYARNPPSPPNTWRLTPDLPVSQVAYFRDSGERRPMLPHLFRPHVDCASRGETCP